MASTLTPEDVMFEASRVMCRPFAWGHCDCCSAACDIFAALWGVDPMAPVRGYLGASGARRMMKSHGGLPALADDLADRSGLSEGHAVGGIALSHEISGNRSLLICIKPGFWAGKSLNGMAILRSAAKGWHA